MDARMRRGDHADDYYPTSRGAAAQTNNEDWT